MGKPPFGPKVAGRIAFFFGPVAGAMVTAVSLRRMGRPQKARRVQRWTLIGAAVLTLMLIVLPDGLGRLVGFGTEIALYAIYKRLQVAEFAEWQMANPGIEPSNGWGALLWGFAGLVLFLLMAFAIVFVLSMIFPNLL